MCWTLTGFASGYLSQANEQEVYCIEERCRGNGDAYCRVVGRPLGEWGDAITPHLAYYQKACLDAELSQVTSELRRVEPRLRARRQEARANERPVVSGFILESPAMHRVIDVARRVCWNAAALRPRLPPLCKKPILACTTGGANLLVSVR